MRNSVVLLLALLILASCDDKKASVAVNTRKAVTVNSDGKRIEFADTASANFFKTAEVKISKLTVDFSAPASVVATVIPSVESGGQNLVLFHNPELTSNYTSLLQHLINIKTYTATVERLKDLAKNGAATGREVIEAENQLANERAGILEHEAKLKLAGLDPQALLKSHPQSVWLICDIPETQLNNIKPGMTCSVSFSSLPDRKFMGKIEDWGNIVDPVTRMIKLRISVNNPSNLLKAGMFATASFESAEREFLTVPKEAVVSVQGKFYVFSRLDELIFERREIQTGDQVQENVVIFGGLKEKENVVRTGTMQMKGISFGY